MVNIVVGGDLAITGRSSSCFAAGAAGAIFTDLLEAFENSDLSIVNLESPLTRIKNPILKTGPPLGADIECINGIKAAGISVLNLANNHIMDHGAEGLQSTIEQCDQRNIKHVGAGRNLASARRILVCNVKEMRVGFMGVAEHEFSIATDSGWGAAPLDPIDQVRNLRERRRDFDRLVVLLHGGSEHYPYPSPRLMDVCRFLVEEGADAVICQHSHCPGCFEVYRGGCIVYGQGNLMFDPHRKLPKTWHQGFLVQLRFCEKKQAEMDLIPFSQCDGGYGARKLTGAAKDVLLRQVRERSLEILEPGFVKRRWREYCLEHEAHYLSMLNGHNRLQRVLNRTFNTAKWFLSTERKLNQRNMVICETHREILETLLELQREKHGAAPGFAAG